MMLLIRKSQMTFDFSAPKHDELRTVHAGTRHLQNGASIHVAEHRRHTQVADTEVHVNKFKDIARKWGVSAAKERARTFAASAVLSREFGETAENLHARKPELGRLHQWIVDGFQGIKTAPDPRVNQADQEYAEWQAKQKQPWQQTKEEYGNNEDHGIHVFRALQHGKPVPVEVKAQYPELGYLTQDSKKHIRKSFPLTHILRKGIRNHHTAYERHIASGTVAEIRQKGIVPTYSGQPVKAPNGTYDFGIITAEIAKQIGKFPAKIRLLRGEHTGLHKGTGLIHIRAEHGRQIKAAGFASPEDFVQYVAINYDAVYKAKKGRLALVVEGPPQQIAIIEVRKNKKGGFYSVCTAYPPKNIKFTGTPLWRGRQPSLSDSGDQQPLPMIPKDHPAVVTKSLNHPTSTSGQSASGKANISKSKDEINRGQVQNLL